MPEEHDGRSSLSRARSANTEPRGGELATSAGLGASGAVDPQQIPTANPLRWWDEIVAECQPQPGDRLPPDPVPALEPLNALGHAVALASHRVMAFARDPQLHGTPAHAAWVGVFSHLVDAGTMLGANAQVRALARRSNFSGHCEPATQCVQWLVTITDPLDVHGPAMLAISDAVTILAGLMPIGVIVRGPARSRP